MRILKNVVLSFCVAYPAGGFVMGVFLCEDCTGIVGNLLGRLFIGVVMSLNSMLFFGFPLADEAGTSHLNAWPYIVGCWAACLAWLAWRDRKRRRATS